MHDFSLIATIATGFGLAMVFGFIAARLKMPPLVGYLLAGIAIGPGTPGFVGDIHLAGQLAEIGVMLLMFGVGLHFSMGDLLSVKRIAVPGAIVQIAVATALGLLMAWSWWGWSFGAALVLGPGPVGGQHRGVAEGPGVQRPARIGERAHRRGLAGGGGPGDGPRAGAAAAAGRHPWRASPARIWPARWASRWPRSAPSSC